MTDPESKWIHIAQSGERRYLNGVEVDPEAYSLILEAARHDESATQQFVRRELHWNRALSSREIELVAETLAKIGEA